MPQPGALLLRCSGSYAVNPGDIARRKKGLRHGGDHIQVTLNESLLSKSKTVCGEDLMALDEAVEKLEGIDTTKAELVKLRLFGRLAGKQAADCSVIGLMPDPGSGSK